MKKQKETYNQDFATLLNEAVSMPGKLHEAFRAFWNYSAGNSWAAYHQCLMMGIKPGPIATFNGWKEKGRFVKKGSRAIYLCMPVTTKKEIEKDGKKEDVVFTFFVWKKNWFVLDQTEGVDYYPEEHCPDWSKEKALAELGITEEEFSDTNGNTLGYAYTGENTISVSPLAPHKIRVALHEIAHCLMHGKDGEEFSDGKNLSYDVREVEAECVAYIVAETFNLQGTESSRAYIQHYLKEREIEDKTARRIFSAADKIIKAGAIER